MELYKELRWVEQSLLLYLETCAVDFAGRIDQERMSDTDRRIAERWAEEGYIRYGRVKGYAPSKPSVRTHWCELSEHALNDAHILRRLRIERGLRNRVWKRVGEEK